MGGYFVSIFFMEVFTIATKEKDLLINQQIHAREVLVIGPNGEQLGLKQIQDALTLASYAGFDLVLISPTANPQVCKLMDYNKFKYESKKKAKENMKRQKETRMEMKEYRLSVGIDIGDFNTRVKNAREYLTKGYRIKASIRFRGRELAHLDRGFDVFKRFSEALKDVAVVDTKAAMDGEKTASMILAPIKEK